MPIYEYECEDCGTRFDKLVRGFSAPAEVTCPECGSAEVRKAFSTFASLGSRSSTSAASSASDACAPSG